MLGVTSASDSNAGNNGSTVQNAQTGLQHSSEEVQGLTQQAPRGLFYTPRNKMELQRFVGHVSYFTQIAVKHKPELNCLASMTSPHRQFLWNSEHQSAFDKLRRALIISHGVNAFRSTSSSERVVDRDVDDRPRTSQISLINTRGRESKRGQSPRWRDWNRRNNQQRSQFIQPQSEMEQFQRQNYENGDTRQFPTGSPTGYITERRAGQNASSYRQAEEPTMYQARRRDSSKIMPRAEIISAVKNTILENKPEGLRKVSKHRVKAAKVAKYLGLMICIAMIVQAINLIRSTDEFRRNKHMSLNHCKGTELDPPIAVEIVQPNAIKFSMGSFPIEQENTEHGDTRIRKKRDVARDMSDIRTVGVEKDFLIYSENVSKTFLSAEHNTFDFSEITDQMREIRDELASHRNKTLSDPEVTECFSANYPGWKKIGYQYGDLYYATMRRHTTFDQCQSFCMSKNSQLVYDIHTLKGAFAVLNFSSKHNYTEWTTAYKDPGVFLDYKHMVGPTIEVEYKEPDAPKWEYTFEYETHIHDDLRRRKIEGLLKYKDNSQSADPADDRHLFGSINLRTACNDKKDKDTFIYEEIVQRTPDKKEVFQSRGEISKAIPIYLGTLDNTVARDPVLSCRRFGYENSPSANRVANCICIAKEPIEIAQNFMEEISDVALTLESHLNINPQRNVTRRKRRKKRFAWWAAARVFFTVAKNIWMKVGSKASLKMAADPKLGITKGIAFSLIQALSIRAIVTAIFSTDESPAKAATGKKATGEIYDLTKSIIKHTRDNHMIKFQSSMTHINGTNTYDMLKILAKQATRLIAKRRRIFELIHSGQFSSMKAIGENDEVASAAQITAEMDDENDDIGGRHVLTQLTYQPPEPQLRAIPLPVARHPNGDYAYYELGDQCQFEVKAKKDKHGCKRVSGEYQHITTVRIGHKYLFIVTDRYPELIIRCDGQNPIYQINRGLLVFYIEGKFTISFTKGDTIRSREGVMQPCRYKPVVDKQLTKATMTHTHRVVNNTLTRLGLMSVNRYHTAGFAVTATVTAALLGIFVLAYRKGWANSKGIGILKEANEEAITNLREQLDITSNDSRQNKMSLQGLRTIEEGGINENQYFPDRNTVLNREMTEYMGKTSPHHY